MLKNYNGSLYKEGPRGPYDQTMQQNYIIIIQAEQKSQNDDTKKQKPGLRCPDKF